MRTLQWAQFRQRQRLWKVFLGIWSPAMTPVTLSGISPRHMHHLAEGFLPLSDAYQLKLTLLLIATEDPQIFGSFTKIWYYLLLVLSFCLCHCSFLGEANYWRWSKKSPFTGTPMPSGKAHEIEREKSSCKKSYPKSLQILVKHAARPSANAFKRSEVSTGSWIFLPVFATLEHLECHTYVKISHFCLKILVSF